MILAGLAYGRWLALSVTTEEPGSDLASQSSNPMVMASERLPKIPSNKFVASSILGTGAQSFWAIARDR